VLQLKPDVLGYPQNFPKYRYYGNNIKYMIDVANKWDEGDMKTHSLKWLSYEKVLFKLEQRHR
jgi:hypothetical protein